MGLKVSLGRMLHRTKVHKLDLPVSEFFISLWELFDHLASIGRGTCHCAEDSSQKK
jgi:hypothetical protein